MARYVEQDPTPQEIKLIEQRRDTIRDSWDDRTRKLRGGHRKFTKEASYREAFLADLGLDPTFFIGEMVDG